MVKIHTKRMNSENQRISIIRIQQPAQPHEKKTYKFYIFYENYRLYVVDDELKEKKLCEDIMLYASIITA